ncbi:MAG: GH3 auxin-responsive promoter family protein [Bacteroidia bacterium]
MSLTSIIARPFSKFIAKQIYKDAANAVSCQHKIMHQLIANAQNTIFGKDHNFKKILSYNDFVKHIPVRDYEDFKPYIEKLKHGEPDVLWPGKPLYLSKTSGTTSGIKYIPITKESISNHISGARNALLMYIAETGKSDFVSRKLIFLSGSPELDSLAGIPTGRLSGIVNHHIPQYLRKNQMPSFKTNCIDDWEKKVEAIVDETLKVDMSLISGIPPWVQMYFEKLTERTGKKIKDIFPNFSLFVYGGVNYEPYRNKIETTIGKRIDGIELYPASEGFIAFQDSQVQPGLLLNINSGIFYEFIKADDFFKPDAQRISLGDVELNVNYAVIINSNAGLWGYSIGDTVKFVSDNPYRIVVSGRIKHFISAFGEHVIGEEVEKALHDAVEQHPCEIIEFTVAPQVSPQSGLPYHEWFIEFASQPIDIKKFSEAIDASLQKQNIYYHDLITGNILQPLKIKSLRRNAFIDYMKAEGKLGGQNKVPRLGNDRKIADQLTKFVL